MNEEVEYVLVCRWCHERIQVVGDHFWCESCQLVEPDTTELPESEVQPT